MKSRGDRLLPGRAAKLRGSRLVNGRRPKREPAGFTLRMKSRGDRLLPGRAAKLRGSRLVNGRRPERFGYPCRDKHRAISQPRESRSRQWIANHLHQKEALPERFGYPCRDKHRAISQPRESRSRQWIANHLHHTFKPGLKRWHHSSRYRALRTRREQPAPQVQASGTLLHVQTRPQKVASQQQISGASDSP